MVYRLSSLLFDLLHPDQNEEKQKHKLKKLVQKPNSFSLILNANHVMD